MNYCPECGTSIIDSGRFCDNCGAQLNTYGNCASNAGRTNAPRPLLSSKSCKYRLEEEWKNKPAMAVTLIGVIAVLLGLVTFGPLILAYLRDEPKYVLEKYIPSTGLCVFVLAVFTGIAILVGVLTSKLKESYLQYTHYCQREYLEIGTEGISGSNVYGKINLRFEDIGNVLTYPNNQNDKFAVIKVDVLKIVDRSGKSYFFYSFNNAMELAGAIRRQPAYSTGKKTTGRTSPARVAQSTAPSYNSLPSWKQVELQKKAETASEVTPDK